MMPLPVVAAGVPPAFAFGCPPAIAWNAPEHRSPAPPQAVTPDGFAHQLTASADRVCWWSIDEYGDARVHRYWYRRDAHPVAIAAREDGGVVLLAKGEEWEVWLVEPDGAERRWPTWGAAGVVQVRVADRVFEVVWNDGRGDRLISRVDLDDGALLELTRERRSDDVPRSPR